jgi:hypothetical protein
MEGGKMRVRIVVNDEMNTFHEPTAGHREIAFNDNRNHSTIFRHDRHVEVHVTASNGTITKEIFEKTGDFFVGDFGVLVPECKARGADQGRPDNQTRDENSGGGAKEAAASWLVAL